MTVLSFDRTATVHTPRTNSAFAAVSGAFVAFQLAWRRRQTERAIEGLPSELRKDIGWPSTDERPRR